MAIRLQVQQGGTLTLPANLCHKHRIKPGGIFHLLNLYGIFVLAPMVPTVPELTREIERMRQEAGLSIEELLTSLREQREQVHRERYGDAQTTNAQSANPSDC